MANYSNLLRFSANFQYFHKIPSANELQFAKVFSAKLSTVLIRQPFLPPKFFTIRYTFKTRNLCKNFTSMCSCLLVYQPIIYGKNYICHATQTDVTYNIAQPLQGYGCCLHVVTHRLILLKLYFICLVCPVVSCY